MSEIDCSAIIKKAHWSDLLLALGKYDEEQYQFTLSTTYQQFWETCPRGEWLFYWIAKEGSTPHKSIVHASCQCARLALPHCTDQQQRPLKCIETTERWIRGEATLEEVRQARDVAHTAASSSAASSAASSFAAYSAAWTSTSATSATYAAAASYTTASCAASAANHAAPENQEASRQSMQLQTADIVRSLIPRPDKMVKEYERLLKMRAFL